MVDLGGLGEVLGGSWDVFAGFWEGLWRVDSHKTSTRQPKRGKKSDVHLDIVFTNRNAPRDGQDRAHMATKRDQNRTKIARRLITIP